MHVQRDSSYACNRFRDRWAKQDIVHEMSVYDVEMKPVGTRFFYRAHSEPRWVKSDARTEGATTIGLLFIGGIFGAVIFLE